MLNRFQRTVSTHAYYGYINRYHPEHLRKYQSQRYYSLGRKGAFDTLVLKMSCDHINYEQDFNLRYKVPALITNLSMRLAVLWFVAPTIFICFYLGDMTKLFTPHVYGYLYKPNQEAEAPTRYETMYIRDRTPKF